MRVVETINDIRAIVKSQRAAGKSIGFVPTMGCLHEGHISLARESIRENDFTIMSIFVNPTQFGVNEDFDKYPRRLEEDSRMAEEVGVDVIFAPSVKEMYPGSYKTFVNVEGITEVLCGKSRPGHFRGVTTVVSKLFNIVQPDKAYFGQKDAQQVLVIKKMVKDLDMNIDIITCPIVREHDGLAMSSRNVYLSGEERKAALVLSKSLFEAEKMILNGERDCKKILNYINEKIAAENRAQVDYISMVDVESLEEISEIQRNVLIALAVKIGGTRLIDNVIVEV
ncbi:MAG: pantoate--beta-alanine ligase [Clostridia bacterium]|nr:pantoate--beta-alanine ligase [Clostridia bacterium]